MKVDIHFFPQNIEDLLLKEKIVVVVDVLRASTSIATAIYNGAREVVPVLSVAEAGKIAINTGGSVVLGGERNGVKIEGFHVGNSPREYTEEIVKGKTVVFSSTNGAVALVKTKFAKYSLIGSFANVSLVADFLLQQNQDFMIICAGKQHAFCIEDTVCAGMIIRKVADAAPIEPTDAAVASLALYENFGHSILEMLQSSEHGLFLQEIGFGNDLEVCAAVDSLPVLPVYANNAIHAWKVDNKPLLT
ncbi:MAG: 2-phosphosulfolactate phosphatase [Ignavibacteriales bacterium]|nr:2-phosphosulfolactate phosphatase [Ignavibacteriales bacterium]